MKYSIIVTGFNCENYVKECIDSILAQTEQDFNLYIANDASTDNTQLIIDTYEYNEKVIFLEGINNLGALYWRQHYVACFTADIVLFVGMDDYLEPNALEVLNKYYENPAIKMTYGSWRTIERQAKVVKAYPSEVFINKSFRTHEWLATSLNSFKRELLLQVPKEKLIDPETNEFYTNCTDLAYSFPCLEMCKENEVAVVKEFIYIYRHDHDNTTLNRLGKADKSRVRQTLREVKPL